MDFWVCVLRIGPSAGINGWEITNDYFYFRLLRFVKKKETNRRTEEHWLQSGNEGVWEATVPGELCRVNRD
jgi:hypothetical protein